MKQKLFLALRILVAVGLLVFLFSKIDINAFLTQLAHAQLSLCITGLSLYFIIALLAIVRWKILLDVHDVRVPFYKLTKLFFIGLFFNNAMPGLTGGDVIKGYYVAKETTLHKPEAVTTVFLDRIVGVIGLLLIGIIALMFNLQNPAFRKLAVILFVLFGTLVVFTPVLLSKRIMKKIPFLAKLIEIIPFSGMIVRIYQAFYKYKSHKSAILYGLVLSMVLQCIYMIMVAVLGLSIGLKSVALSQYFLFIPVISTISAVPISISGLGVNEQLYVYCFGLAGADSESSLAIALMARLVLLIWSLPGWVYYMTIGSEKISEKTMEQEINALKEQI